MKSHLPQLLVTLGMQTSDIQRPADQHEWYNVLLDGRVVGRIQSDMADEMTKKMRILKALGKDNVC